MMSALGEGEDVDLFLVEIGFTFRDVCIVRAMVGGEGEKVERASEVVAREGRGALGERGKSGWGCSIRRGSPGEKRRKRKGDEEEREGKGGRR